MGNIREHAIREMKLAKVDEDIYGDMTSKAVLKMIDAFESEGHSGMSASIVLSIFNRVINFANLTPLTNDPEEWQQHDYGTWQNKRNSSAFSLDRGSSYYLLGDGGNWETDEHGKRTRTLKFYMTERVPQPESESLFSLDEEEKEGTTDGE